MSKLILASSSPRRERLMREAGFEFEIIVTDAQEISEKFMIPWDLTVQNAKIKATPVAQANPNKVVIGADTVVSLDNEIFGKPSDMEEAAKMLARLSGRTHIVTTGVCILQKEKNENFYINTEVTFKTVSDADINKYLEVINPLDKAGAYAAQDHGELIIEKYSGSYTNVVGLPISELKETLANSFQIYPTI
ncbi:MAG: Maf family protein [Verrucomicrobiota bacterium]|nr:Maf family protein [Verrucomicrobiota bacterium]